MKLALVVKRLSTHGGTERFVSGLAAWLAGRGHQVDAWCVGVDTPVEGVEVRSLGWAGRGRLGRLVAFDRAARRIPAQDYDLVIGFARGGAPELFRAGGGCHEAWMRAGSWTVADELERAIDRRVVHSAHRVVVNSQLAARDLVAHYGVPAHRIRLIRNGVDLARFRPRPGAAPLGSVPTVVFVGSGFARKGLETAIRAVARLDGVRLLVLGTDPRPGRYRRLAARVGMANRFDLLGRCDRPEEILPGAAALVLPTRYDSFANACLEAMACGVPVVTSQANGAAEVLPEPWMVVSDPEDADAFAASLARALREPGLGSACRDAAEAWPAAQAFERIEELVVEMVQARAKREEAPAGPMPESC